MMRGLALATLAVLTVCSISEPVVNFEMEQNIRLKTFKFVNCIPEEKEKVVVNNLVLKPDPVVFPGMLTISFNITFKEEVHSSLEAVVYLARKVGQTYVKLPCLGDIGSCTYSNICGMLSIISQCPPSFISAGVPCHCPFEKGTYTLPATTYNVDAAVFSPGDYHAQANLTMNGDLLGCYDLHVSFA